MDEILDRATIIDPAVAAHHAASVRLRKASVESVIAAMTQPPSDIGGHHHHSGGSASVPLLEPQPVLDGIQHEHSRAFARWLLLWKVGHDELAGFGGELDTAVQMPGWTNVWTMPIQNRVDMLTTGVNTPIGIRVLGRNLDDVVRGSEEVARVVRGVRGAADVVADPLRGKPYIEVRLDRERAARLGVRAGEVNELIETALAGKMVATTVEGRERHPVVVRYARARREDEESVRNLLVTAYGVAQGQVRTRTQRPLVNRFTRSHSRRSRRSASSRVLRRSKARTDCFAITCGSAPEAEMPPTLSRRRELP